MRDFTQGWRLPGRPALAAGIAGLGAVALTFGHLLEGLTPLAAGPPWPRVQGAALIVLGGLLFWSRAQPVAAKVLTATLAVNLVLHLPGLAAAPSNVVGWVSAAQVMGVLAAVLTLVWPGSSRAATGARLAVGVMLILFGAVHWMYVDAIAGMIPDWMPGRALWPWLTGAANIAAGLALGSGLLARMGAALVGLMFASWIPLVHLPRLIAAPGDRAEWQALALCVALIGVVWTVRDALDRPRGEV